MRLLILCTGNSCRSQMAEGILRYIDPKLEIFSAGTRPEKEVNPNAIKAMQEIGIDISHHTPKLVDKFTATAFDWVITVCDSARESCPLFTGNVKNRIHIGFEDPAAARGTEDEVLPVYRKVRNQILEEFESFYLSHLKL